MAAAFVVVTFGAARHADAQIAPEGIQFQINTYTTGSQARGVEGYPVRRAVSRRPNGDFVVVWASTYGYQDGDSDGLFGQRFDANADKVGTEFQVNTYTTSYQYQGAVSYLADGSFVVVWESYSQDGDGKGVFGQRFSASGSRAGTEFAINTYTTGEQGRPSVAPYSDGFVVVWFSYNQDGDGAGVFGRRFTATGGAIGSEFQVNSYTTGDQGYQTPNVAGTSLGGFVVVWTGGAGQDGSLRGVFGQRFSASGAPAGTEFQVNSYTTAAQYDPNVAMNSSGSFVVAWDSNGQDGSSDGIFAQRFTNAGAPDGTEFQVNSYTTGFQYQPAVAMDDAGSFIVTWQGKGTGEIVDAGVFARHFDAAGAATGGDILVNTYTTAGQVLASVATDGAGRFVVVWEDYGDQDGDARGMFGQRLAADTDGDGAADLTDNCPDDNNPDQLNSDCPDSSFFTSGSCSGSVSSTFLGCCDGGDVCDVCPANSDNTACDEARTASATIGPDGGVINTTEVNGTISATVVIPANALTEDTSISITENGPATRFGLKKSGGTATVLSLSARPEGQHFDLPVQVTLRWDDRDMDGLVDRGLCEGGADDGLPCDQDADCAGNSCSVNANVAESDLVLKRNSSRFSMDGFGVGPFTCADHLAGSGCEGATADCSAAAGTGLSAVAKCCDPTAGPSGTRTFGEWTFETCDFSELFLGLVPGDFVAGKGSLKTDCITEWAVHNPLNPTYLDDKDLPNFKQTCRDGDPVCDADGTADGVCTILATVCTNLDDPRLVKNGVVECAPSDLEQWELKRPRLDSDDGAEAINAFQLLNVMASLGAFTNEDQTIVFGPAISQAETCADWTFQFVPLGGPNADKKGKMVIKTKATTSPPAGKKRGTKDSDKLKITCLPGF